MTTKYLLNKLETGLGLKTGHVSIPAGGHLEVTDEDLTDPSFIYAIKQKWAEVVDKKPAGPEKKELNFVKPQSDGSISEAELLASRKQPTVEAPKAIVEDIGKPKEETVVEATTAKAKKAKE